MEFNEESKKSFFICYVFFFIFLQKTIFLQKKCVVCQEYVSCSKLPKNHEAAED